MNSERRERCSRDRSAVGSGISAFSGYSFRADEIEYCRNQKRGATVEALSDYNGRHEMKGTNVPAVRECSSSLHPRLPLCIQVRQVGRYGTSR